MYSINIQVCRFIQMYITNMRSCKSNRTKTDVSLGTDTPQSHTFHKKLKQRNQVFSRIEPTEKQFPLLSQETISTLDTSVPRKWD